MAVVHLFATVDTVIIASSWTPERVQLNLVAEQVGAGGGTAVAGTTCSGHLWSHSCGIGYTYSTKSLPPKSIAIQSLQWLSKEPHHTEAPSSSQALAPNRQTTRATGSAAPSASRRAGPHKYNPATPSVAGCTTFLRGRSIRTYTTRRKAPQWSLCWEEPPRTTSVHFQLITNSMDVYSIQWTVAVRGDILD